jgi:hypothetical protein
MVPHPKCFVLLAAALLLPPWSRAFGQSTAPQSARLIRTVRQLDIAADGSSIETLHNEVRIGDAAAVTQLGQVPVTYIDGLQQASVDEAYTRKPDGRTLPVAADAILTQQAPALPGAPLTDIKEKVIIFPDVEAGDTLVYTIRLTNRPLFPGQISYDSIVPPTVAVDDGSLTVTAPAAMPLYTDARGLEVRQSRQGAKTIYTIHYRNAQGKDDSNAPLSRLDRAPRFTLSSFASYDAFAAAYQAAAAPMMAITPEIRQAADRITAGATDSRDKAQKLYDWMAGHIRYVAVELGAGGALPHNAAQVLVNAYGDCKDQAVLFTALLKAEGIEAEPALINAANSYQLSKVPAFTNFNHMIVWLPQLGFYADTTSHGIVPFGELPLAEYGKPVVLLTTAPGALQRTPLLSEKDSTIAYRLDASFDAQGHEVTKSEISATGPFHQALQVLGLALQNGNGEKLALDLLKQRGLPASAGSFSAPQPDADADRYAITAGYSSDPLPAVMAGRAFPIPDGLRLFPLTSALFFGPIFDPKYAAADQVPCYSGSATDQERVEFPTGRHIAALPPDMTIDTPHIHYQTHWTAEDGAVSVQRSFTARFDQPLCGGATRDEALAAYRTIATDSATRISLAPASH